MYECTKVVALNAGHFSGAIVGDKRVKEKMKAAVESKLIEEVLLKETLSLIWALQHFNVYVRAGGLS